MQDIKNFQIGTAYYFLENNSGSRLKLVLDYAKDEFKYKIIKDLGDIERLKTQAEVVAKSLLGKKAQRNLAYKLVNLIENF